MKRVFMTVDFVIEVPDEVVTNSLTIELVAKDILVQDNNGLVSTASVIEYETKSCEDAEELPFEGSES